MKWKDAFGIISAAVACTAMVVAGVGPLIAGVLSIVLGVAVWWAWSYYYSQQEREDDAVETSIRDVRSLRTSINELDQVAQRVHDDEIQALLREIGQSAMELREQFEADRASYTLERKAVIDRIEISKKLLDEWAKLEKLSILDHRDSTQQSFSTIRSFLDDTKRLFSNLNLQIRLGKIAEVTSTVEAMNEIGQLSVGLLDQSR